MLRLTSDSATGNEPLELRIVWGRYSVQDLVLLISSMVREKKEESRRKSRF